ncbi:MAG: type II toxin-antitoxin system RelE/ParE family toxin [Flavobacteriaceae bacterium CG_4_9_14_0_8_um_filter_34_30]|nr:MAG: type II toxin-antitoxin system RelE/ParE family toxin [Flavobacteriaceae bacterium CG_4_10_14_0_8_um_filter_34_31]PJC07614.1 MAG: type II toxin-antitoxin system RelE/ParE family toxin [Flavobacteriaceae bacterium CG_4_9_14_0_8_um_filter_34_30]
MKIVWTDFAIRNLKDIFDYYSTKANKKVAHKIRRQILKSFKQLEHNPNSGPIEPNLTRLKKNHRYLVSGHYKLIYRIIDKQVIINDVFDTRQNPSKMNDENRKEE